MAELVLKASKRASRSLNQLRQADIVPGITYGQGKSATAVQVSGKLLDKVYRQAGSNKLVQLQVEEGAPTNVIFHEVQINPLSQKIIHFDLYSVKMDEKITAEIPIHFINESGAVMTESAVLLKNLETIEIESLPAKLPESFEVDLAFLAKIGDSLNVSDLKVPEGVEVLTEAETLIVKADPPRSEEELEELEEAVEEGAEAAVASEHGTESEEGADAKADDSSEKAEKPEPEEK